MADTVASAAPDAAVSYRRYVCAVCGFIYNEALGDPDEGFAPGTVRGHSR